MSERPRTQVGERFVEAVGFAADVHRAQARKGTDVPYLAHPMAVASLVLEDGGDEDEAIAGLLHDAVEDADGDPATVLEEIRATFGGRVAAIVAACTDVDLRGSTDRSASTWRTRKQHTLDALVETDPPAARVMLADKVHNVRSMLTDLVVEGPRLWERFNAGREDQLWYYRALADTARARQGGSRLASELVGAVEALIEAADGAPSNREPERPGAAG